MTKTSVVACIIFISLFDLILWGVAGCDVSRPIEVKRPVAPAESPSKTYNLKQAGRLHLGPFSNVNLYIVNIEGVEYYATESENCWLHLGPKVERIVPDTKYNTKTTKEE